MKKRRKYLFWLAAILVFSGCSGKHDNKDGSEYQMYYLSLEENEVISDAYEPKAADSAGLIEEFREKLREMPKEAGYLRLLPENIRIEGYELEDKLLVLDMSMEYRDMKDTREILTRAGLVRTFVQIPDIERVEIRIAGDTLKDRNGEPVGTMSAENFLENSGKEINAYQSTSLTLYFADESGSNLVKETRNVYYSTGLPLERVVVEQLIKGPREEGHFQSVSASTKILGITTADNICYVNLDKGFMDAEMTVQEQITIYSLVDSLIYNCKAKQVQISINGKTDLTFRDTMELSKLFEWDDSMLEVEPDD